MIGSEPIIVVAKGPAETKKNPLRKQSVLVGRDPGCDIHLSGSGISPVHIILQQADNTYICVRKGVTPVTVNGRETNQAVLSNNDEIGIGGYVLRYEVPGAEKDVASATRSVSKEAETTIVVDTAGLKKRKLVLIGIAYAVGIVVVLGVYLFRPGQSIVLETPEDAVRLSQEELQGMISLTPAERVRALDLVYKASKLLNRDKVFNLAESALRQEGITGGPVARKAVSRALTAALPSASGELKNGQSYEERQIQVMRDPLFVYLKCQVNRLPENQPTTNSGF